MAFNPDSLKNLRQYAGKSGGEIGPSADAAPANSSAAVQGLGDDTGAILAAAEPVAAAHVLNVAAGRSKVPPHVRAQVCLEILKGRGHLVTKPASEQAAEQFELQQSMLAKLAQALGAKMPRAPVTVDAE